MNQILHIIKFKLISFMKINTDLKPVNILKNLGSMVVYVLFGIGVYLFTKASLLYLLEEIRIGTFLLHRFILIKFLDNFFYSSTTMLLMISAVMLGYSAYFKIDFFFVMFFFFFMLLPFMLIAASLGVILLMFMIRISYKVGLKKVVAGLIMLYLIGLPFFFKSSKPMYALPYVGLLLGTSFLFFIAALFTAKKLYYKTWIESFELKIKNTQSKVRKNSKQIFKNKTFLTPQIDVLLKKEFLQFFREPGQWIHLSVISFLIAIFIVSLGGIDEGLLNAYNYSLRAIIYVVIFSFNLFLISSLSLRFAFPALSLEGDAYWKLKSSPISMRKFVVIKFLILFSFIFLIGQGLNYFSHLNFPKELFLTASINIAFITLAIVSLNFGMGSLFINHKEKSPIRIASSQGASLTFLFTIILIVLLIALLFIPVYNYYNDIFGFQERLKKIYLTSFIIVVVSLTISLISILLTKKALMRDL